MSAHSQREPWQKVSVSDDPIKDWISVTGDTTDDAYDTSTYDTSGPMRQFAWRAKDDATRAADDPECEGELLVELDPGEGEDVGTIYAYGTGPQPVPLRIFMALKFAAKADKRVPVESPVRGGKVDSSPGSFFNNELGYRVQNNDDAFGHKGNFERVRDGA